MEPSSTADLADVLSCLAKLYGHCDDQAFPTRALQSLRELVPCEMAAFELRLDTADKRAIGVSEPYEVHDDPLFAAFEAYMLGDPLVATAKQTGQIPIVAVSELMSRRDYEATAIYCEYFRHYGVCDRLAFSIPSNGPEVMGVALNRRRRGFSDRDRRVLRMIRPHLIQAWRNAQAVGRLQRHLQDCNVVPPQQPADIPTDTSTSWLRSAGLTSREAEVLAKVAEGLTNKQVAQELGISAGTVTKHLENAFPKLGVSTRAAAAVLYASCWPVRAPNHSAETPAAMPPRDPQ